MASNYSLKLILLFMIATMLSFATSTKAQEPRICTANTTTANSTYEKNVGTLLSSLLSYATANTFYNDTVVSENSSDTVYGLFMCRGDVSDLLCSECVANATQELSSDRECSLSKESVIWYDECMVRYSNVSFFSTVDTSTGMIQWNVANISSNIENSMHLLSNTMKQTAEVAANSFNRFSTNQATLSEIQTFYCLAQCTRDLSTENCTTCLTEAISEIGTCCYAKQGGRVLFPSCNIRYELYPFYRIIDENEQSEGELVTETKYLHKDSEYSEDPGYISHHCSNITGDSAFQSSLTKLFSNFSNATGNGDDQFMKQEGTANGLYTCREDLSHRLCGYCVQNATDQISSFCRFHTEAVIWYNHCWLRYSNGSLKLETSPSYKNSINQSVTDPVQSSVTNALSTKLDAMANATGNSGDRYLTETLGLNSVQTLYILAQCTRDLSSDDCRFCLSDVINSAIPWASLGSIGGQVLYPSCILRFEMFQFYNLKLTEPTPAPGNHRSRTIILILIPTIIVSGILFTFCCYLIRRKVTKNKFILRENFGHESSTIESLQFNFAIIEAATNNFSSENKIGRGGFGEVYKGNLADGRLIAVKRLSRNSKQGVEEFKNEVLLVAKLQHRNLVALIGFCLDELEKILIYEYVPNKSLDYFLFDIKLEKVLSWSERYIIIGGIARGILYLHEHSRLKVIHRDLKPSNVLLDENMNPKISDFGLARIVEIDQQEGNTKRIIGTYGYMSPEYAMFGQFSEKSDVYSFGVMILEIISGKKSSYKPHLVADGLLNFVWRYWKDETPLNTLDPKLKDNYSNIEVIKCIQIGLLCVQENLDARPTMVTIVSYLSSHSIELPSPQEPSFFLHHRMDSIAAHESSSSSRQSISSSIPSSINEMSISKFYPR